MQIMNKNGFSRCGELYIGLLRKEGRFSTATVYQNALFSFNNFVVMPVYLSGKSPVTDCVVTGNICMIRA